MREDAKLEIGKILQTANPQIVLKFSEPKSLPSPLFIEFERAAVFWFDSPENFQKSNFESEIASFLAERTTISNPNFKAEWETKNVGESVWRELNLKMVDWKVCYFLRGNVLVLTNDENLIERFVQEKKEKMGNLSNEPFSSLKTLDLSQQEKAFGEVFRQFEVLENNEKFFGENIQSLLDVFADVKKIEVKSFAEKNILDEKLVFYLNEQKNNLE